MRRFYDEEMENSFTTFRLLICIFAIAPSCVLMVSIILQICNYYGILNW